MDEQEQFVGYWIIFSINAGLTKRRLNKFSIALTASETLSERFVAYLSHCITVFSALND